MNSCKAARNSCGWSVCSKWPASGMCRTVERGNNLCILGRELSLGKSEGRKQLTTKSYYWQLSRVFLQNYHSISSPDDIRVSATQKEGGASICGPTYIGEGGKMGEHSVQCLQIGIPPQSARLLVLMKVSQKEVSQRR